MRKSLKSPTIAAAIAFIKRAHEGQTDKVGKPYWRHPVRVMTRLGRRASVVEKQAALLHDVVEDTSTTFADLTKAGFSAEVLAVVELLTRQAEMTYRQYLKRIISSGNMAAMRVKLADLLDNLDLTRIIPDRKEHARLFDRHRQAEQLIRKNLPKALHL